MTTQTAQEAPPVGLPGIGYQIDALLDTMPGKLPKSSGDNFDAEQTLLRAIQAGKVARITLTAGRTYKAFQARVRAAGTRLNRKVNVQRDSGGDNKVLVSWEDMPPTAPAS